MYVLRQHRYDQRTKSTREQPSTARLKYVPPLDCQRFMAICPLEGLRHGGVKVVNKRQESCLEVVHRRKTGPLEQLARQDAKPQLNLIEPRGMFGGVMKPYLVGGLSEKGRS